MKRYFPLTLLLAAVVFIATTGFQCGSAETTSAKLYIQQKQYEKAEASLQKELQKNARNEEAWFLLGQVRYEMKNYLAMNEAYTRALEVSGVHKNEISRNRLAVWALLYNEGVKNYNAGKDSASAYDTAVDNFQTAISLEPDSSGTYYVAALAYYAKKDYNKAISNLETALQKRPDFTEAARFLGQIHYVTAGEAKDAAGAQAEYEKAAKAFEAAYAADPSNSETITSLIDVYERTKKSDKALELTKNAVTKDPNNKIFRYAYGVFLLKQDQYPDAVEQFKKALEIDPTYADAVYNLGVAYLNWGVFTKAATDKQIEADKKSSKKPGKEDESYKEKFKMALPYLEKSAELRPDDAGLWQQLGKLYAILNMPDKSKSAFERFDKLSKSK